MVTHDLRFGILGTGRVARRFASSLGACAGAVPHAVASREVERGQTFAKDLGLERVHASLEELARDPEVDAIYVATPTQLHADHTRRILELDKPVLCEKPLASSLGEAEGVVEFARRRNLFLMEGMWMRFVPLMGEVRAVARNGGLGQLHLLRADVGFPLVGEDAPGPREDALLALGIYPVSLALDLLGVPREVRGDSVLAPNGTVLQSTITLTYEHAQAVLTASSRARAQNDANLLGARAGLHVEAPLFGPEAMTITPWPKDVGAGSERATRLGDRLGERLRGMAPRQRRWLPGLRRLLGRERRIRRPFASHGYQFEAAEVVRCLREGLEESPVMPLEHSLRGLEILDRVRASRLEAPAGGATGRDGSEVDAG